MSKFRGYECLNPSMLLPALTCLAQHYSPAALNGGERFRRDPHENEALKGSLEFLLAQGVLKPTPDTIEAGPLAGRLFGDCAAIEQLVVRYGDLAALVEHLIGIRKNAPEGLAEELPERLDQDKSMSVYWIQALIPAALTFLHECPTRKNPGETMARALARDGELDLSKVLPEALDQDAVAPLIRALIERGLLNDIGPTTVGTSERGHKLLALGGYAELILSYYPVFQRLKALSEGSLRYGLGRDVNRAAELNARASNGIIELRVAPAITSLFEKNAYLRQTLASHGNIAMDFGAGGGEMVQACLKSPLVERAYGLDVNPDAVDEARQLARERGIPKANIKFLVGSIGDRGAFEAFRFGLLDGARPVCTINFILHDVGPKMAGDFLTHFKDVLPASPLIITESFRLPLAAMIDHPNYQAPSFKFMHDISGQHLFYKEEFENFMAEMGFRILEEIPHSSMFWKKENQKLTTITTYVMRL